MAHRQTTRAPGGLALVQDLLNTRYGQRQRLHDAWPDREEMRSWLVQHGLITADTPVSDGDYRRALTVREALRHMLQRGDADSSTVADAHETLNQMARHLPLMVQFPSASSVLLSPESAGVDGVLARVFGEVYAAMLTGTWTRLKICRNTACGGAFYDTSKNHSGVWCSMATCGNRMHARAYRQQRKQRSADL